MRRREFVAGAAAAGVALAVPWRFAGRAPAAGPFMQPLRIPQVLTGDDLTIRMFEADVPVLPGQPTRMWTYDGTFPGPTIRRPGGRPTRITFVHELPEQAGHLTVHRHGGHNRASEDGQPGGHTADNPEAICDLTPQTEQKERYGTDLLIPPGGRRTYLYDMVEEAGPERAAFEWYHDHRCDVTGRNLWNGLAGMFIVDDDVDLGLPLPKGEHDVPLMIVDRSFLADNQLANPFFRPQGGPLGSATPQGGLPPNDEVVGERILVNGGVQPYFEVAARRYRLRVLNAANFTSYNIALSTGEDLVQIGTESGLLPAPIRRRQILLGPAERAEIVVDFAGKLGQQLVLRSESLPDERGANAPPAADLMQFRVVRPALDDSSVPGQLRPLPGWAKDLAAAPDRVWVFELDYDRNRLQPAWGINGQTWNPDRVDAYPRLGTTESWQLTNASNVTHVIHLHSGDWVTLSRNGEPPPAWEQGLKETWRLDPGETVVVGTKFADHPGRFVIHCHMLEHEDHGMMTNFELLGEGVPIPADDGSGSSDDNARPGAGGATPRRPLTLGLPSPRSCRSGRIAFRLRPPGGVRNVRRATVYVDGRRVRLLRARRALSRLIRLRLGAGRSRVTVVVVTRDGRRYAATRQYRCSRPRRRRRPTTRS
jgi:FtsP/CotA-like multicopper oxidase with cupredoxin domain